MAESYVSAVELKSWIGVDDDIDDPTIDAIVEAASRSVDKWCARRFYLDATATARTYRVVDEYAIYTDDFDPATVPVVALDTNDDGTFDTTYQTAQFVTEPPNSLPGEPRNKIRLLGTTRFQSFGELGTVRVTAKWGWPEVPAPVKVATRMLAQDLFTAKDAPFGVAGNADTGYLRIGSNGFVRSLLAPYRFTI